MDYTSWIDAKWTIALVLLVVIVLIAAAVWLIRRFGAVTLRVGGSRGRQPRLAVLESAVVDARRRLVLIRRDNFEHLLMIGGPTDVVVEHNIVRATPPAAPAVAPPAAQAAPTPREPIVRAAGRPAVLDAAEAETESPLVPAPAIAPEPIQAPIEPPPAAPQPRAAALDPQYSEMAQRLEAALRRPMDTAAMPRVEPLAEPHIEPRPATAPTPRVEPRPPQPAIPPQPAPQPRPAPAAQAPTPPQPAMPRPAQPAPMPQPAAAPPVRAPVAPTPQPAASPRPAPPAPTPPAAKPAPKRDVFDNLEEEMANLLGRSKPN